MAYNEKVITVGIGWVLLTSATSGFSGYIKLAYCSTAKGALVAQLVRASGSRFFGISLLSQKAYLLTKVCNVGTGIYTIVHLTLCYRHFKVIT